MIEQKREIGIKEVTKEGGEPAAVLRMFGVTQQGVVDHCGVHKMHSDIWHAT